MSGVLLGTLAVKLKADTAEFARDLKGASTDLQGVADTAKKVGAVAAVAFGSALYRTRRARFVPQRRAAVRSGPAGR